jgi:hypothetical protein
MIMHSILYENRFFAKSYKTRLSLMQIFKDIYTPTAECQDVVEQIVLRIIGHARNRPYDFHPTSIDSWYLNGEYITTPNEELYYGGASAPAATQ